jgi:hypothetical protein
LDGPDVRIPQPREQHREGGLPGTRGADDGDDGPRWDRDLDIGEDRLRGVVTERETMGADLGRGVAGGRAQPSVALTIIEFEDELSVGTQTDVNKWMTKFIINMKDPKKNS